MGVVLLHLRIGRVTFFSSKRVASLVKMHLLTQIKCSFCITSFSSKAQKLRLLYLLPYKPMEKVQKDDRHISMGCTLNIIHLISFPPAVLTYDELLSLLPSHSNKLFLVSLLDARLRHQNSWSSLPFDLPLSSSYSLALSKRFALYCGSFHLPLEPTSPALTQPIPSKDLNRIFSGLWTFSFSAYISIKHIQYIQMSLLTCKIPRFCCNTTLSE